MVVEEVLSVLPPSILARIEGLVLIFKFVGIAFIVYIIYLIIMGIFLFKRIKRMKFIEKKVIEINKKLDKLLNKKVKK